MTGQQIKNRHKVLSRIDKKKGLIWYIEDRYGGAVNSLESTDKSVIQGLLDRLEGLGMGEK